VLLAGVIGGYQLRVRSVASRNLELETQVEERTQALEQRTREIERRRQVAEGLREILVILNSNRPLTESLDRIVSQSAALTGAERAVILRFEETGHIAIVTDSPSGQADHPTGEGLPAPTANWIAGYIRQGRPLIVPDIDSYRIANPGVAPPGLREYRALLGIPLSVGGQMYGGLVLFFGHERPFPEEDLELGFNLADQAALAIANAQLRDRAEEMAAATERSRLARDLHDAVTQTLFSASLIAEVLPSAWERDQREGLQLLQDLRQLTRGALAEMRTLLLELRPAALVETSLSDLLRQLADAVTGRTGAPVTVTVEGKIDLPSDVHVALYRIAQEALNNVVRHARASQVAIGLHCVSSPGATDKEDQGIVELRVTDDGRGFDPSSVSPDHLGLGIIRERAQAIGATVEVESHPGHGTQLIVVWEG